MHDDTKQLIYRRGPLVFAFNFHAHESYNGLRIPVPDRAGVLAEITSLAGDAGIGIYDIEIAHSAEGPRGVLILVVDGADAETLTAAVEARGYRCVAEHLS